MLPIEDHPSGRLDASHDTDYAPDVEMRDGDVLEGAGFTLEAVHTPGHASNHLCFALKEEGSLFSGDHVMAWSTTVVAPPDGDMAAYMASLERLGARAEETYYPGHGAPATSARRYVRGLAVPQAPARSGAILARIAAGDARHRDDRRAHLRRPRPAPRARRLALGARAFAGHDRAWARQVKRRRGDDGRARYTARVTTLPVLTGAEGRNMASFRKKKALHGGSKSSAKYASFRCRCRVPHRFSSRLRGERGQALQRPAHFASSCSCIVRAKRSMRRAFTPKSWRP